MKVSEGLLQRVFPDALDNPGLCLKLCLRCFV